MQSNEHICAIGSEQVPYFRTPEFSKIMKENEQLILKFSGAPKESRAVFLTGSGTAGMEAVVINLFSNQDKVLIINGGSFGQRFVDMLKIHNIPFSDISLPNGKSLTARHLIPYENKGYTALLVNMHETSTGVLYDMNLLADFCRRNHLFLAVDAISSFLADKLDMSEQNIGVMITSSQKALACPPGISIITLAPNALQRLHSTVTKCMYFDLKAALEDGKRGQTPFTPAVSILRQINCRLKQIDVTGGVSAEISRIAEQASDFREKIKDLPFELYSETCSNAVTALHPTTASAYDIFTILKDEYNIWVCPNGGNLRDSVFRVGHIGNLTKKDNSFLVDAFRNLQTRGII